MSTELPQDTGATFWYVGTREEPGIRHDSQKVYFHLFVSKFERYDGMTTEETACPDVYEGSVAAQVTKSWVCR